MTLAVMTRASLGHTGRELFASAGTQAIYALAVAGALARICASLEPVWSGPLLLVCRHCLGFGLRGLRAPLRAAALQAAPRNLCDLGPLRLTAG